jgi:hypothetical protein
MEESAKRNSHCLDETRYSVAVPTYPTVLVPAATNWASLQAQHVILTAHFRVVNFLRHRIVSRSSVDGAPTTGTLVAQKVVHLGGKVHVYASPLPRPQNDYSI